MASRASPGRGRPEYYGGIPILRSRVGILAVLQLFSGSLAFGRSAYGQVMEPPAVPAATLHSTRWRLTEQVPALVDAQENAQLAAERPGQVVAVLYKSGQSVAKGTLLVKLDDAPEQAQLALDQARLDEAGRALARDVKLLKIAGASEASFEQAEANLAEARAQVKLDLAALAQLNIIAPFAGMLGIRRISEGDYVQAGQTVAQLTQSGPLRVLFSVPQTEAGDLQPGEKFGLTIASLPVVDANFSGSIISLSPQLDTATDARDVEGIVNGAASGLLPGMYGIVTLGTGTPQPAFSLPATALNDDSLGRFIYVLDPGNGGAYTARAVYVTEFGQSGDVAVIGLKGLKPGEKVVAEGGFKLHDGAPVTLESQ